MSTEKGLNADPWVGGALQAWRRFPGRKREVGGQREGMCRNLCRMGAGQLTGPWTVYCVKTERQARNKEGDRCCNPLTRGTRPGAVTRAGQRGWWEAGSRRRQAAGMARELGSVPVPRGPLSSPYSFFKTLSPSPSLESFTLISPRMLSQHSSHNLLDVCTLAIFILLKTLKLLNTNQISQQKRPRWDFFFFYT